mmetsp:Transcript_22562/g.50845  ORF Transcript_22562/g.50845 Transcript_22562/m.50845 type:complete len:205 (-) Transcript_22562:213-827(-)
MCACNSATSSTLSKFPSGIPKPRGAGIAFSSRFSSGSSAGGGGAGVSTTADWRVSSSACNTLIRCCSLYNSASYRCSFTDASAKWPVSSLQICLRATSAWLSASAARARASCTMRSRSLFSWAAWANRFSSSSVRSWLSRSSCVAWRLLVCCSCFNVLMLARKRCTSSSRTCSLPSMACMALSSFRIDSARSSSHAAMDTSSLA